MSKINFAILYVAAIHFLAGGSLCLGQVDVYLPGDQTPCAKAEVWASIGLKISPDNKWGATVAAPDPGYEEFGSQVDDKRSIVRTSIADHKVTAKISKVRTDGENGHYWFLITDGELLLPSRCFANKVFYSPKHPWTVNPHSRTIEIETVLEQPGALTELLTTSSSYRVEPGPERDSMRVIVDSRRNEFIELLPCKFKGSQVFVLILGMPGATFSGGSKGVINLPGLGQKKDFQKCTIALSVDKKSLLYELGNLGPHKQGTPTKEPPKSTEKTYLEWSTALEKSINSGDPNMLNHSLDSDMIIEKATKGLPIAGADMASFSAGLKSGLSQRNIGWELCEAKRRLGSFRLLRLEKADDGYTALFRLSSYDNFDYIQFSLSQRPGGNVVITDIEYWCRGSRLSEGGRQMAMLLLGSQATQIAPDAEISQWLRALPLLKEMVFMIQAEHYKEAMEAYSKMPDIVRQDKSIMMHRIAAAKGISDQEYLAAVEDFRKLFPTDPAIDFIVFRSRLITGKYEEARKAIDRLEKKVGTDSLLDCLRANVFSAEGNFAKAKAIASEVTKAEPELPQAYWELVLVSLIEKDFRETSRLLSFLESALHAVLPDIETLDGFAEFTRSSEYRRWKETKAVAEKEEARVIKRTQPKHNKQRK